MPDPAQNDRRDAASGLQELAAHHQGTYLRPIRAMGTAVVAVSTLVTAGELVGALTGFAYSSSAWRVYDTITSLAWLALFIVTGIWLTRLRRNADQLAPWFHHQRAWGWAWAGWLVPIVSLWFPFQVVRDAVTASASADTTSVAAASRPPFGLWWATWLVSTILGNLALQVSTVDTAADLRVVGGMSLLGSICLVVSLWAWIKIVRTGSALQSAAG
ncbi:DUF4328 domain-containing protein [Kineococcus sp. R86509]|uniref:DUF4328 domain-containing protein n=1 Tax=Kineococcus sp. R86509 TaxID=3093851 RepID=UPI0036D41AD1